MIVMPGERDADQIVSFALVPVHTAPHVRNGRQRRRVVRQVRSNRDLALALELLNVQHDAQPPFHVHTGHARGEIEPGRE